MGIWNRKCAVEKCGDQDSPRHRFPMPKKFLGRYQKWVEATGNANITKLDPELVYRSYRICHRHFTEESKASNKRLKENAVPTLFCIVSENKAVENEDNSKVTDNEMDTNVLNQSPSLADHTYALNSSICEEPSTSAISDHTYVLTSILTSEPSMQATDQTYDLNKETSNESTAVTMEIFDVPSTSDENKYTLDKYASIDMESEIPITKMKCTLQEAGGEQYYDVTPRKSIACKRAINFDTNMPSTSKQHQDAPDNYVHTNVESETPRTSTNPRKKKYSFNILQEAGVKRICELSPREKFLYEKASRLNRSFKTYKRRIVRFKEKHGSMTEDELLQTLTADLDKHVANFIKLQIKASKVKSPKGRRYNLDDKVLGLILQKQSGKSYKLFSKLFATPTRKTLMELLNRIPIDAGINETIFRNLKLNVNSLAERDRVCVLMFDEMALNAHLDINKKQQEFDGFTDHGDKRTDNFGDHAQIFMVKGITKRWKQPVAYTFSEGTTSSIDLVRQIKSIVGECQKAGLKVVATISDQGSTNVGAINYLVKNYKVPENTNRKLKLYSVNGDTVVHIYDAPHLLKGIRNNFLRKKLVWKVNGSRLTGDWDDIVKTYEIDNEIGRLRALNKLHKGHIYEKHMKKMKVSYATQVFSHTLASIMMLFQKKGITSNDGKIKLEHSAKGTIKILQFFDKLFDSVNGHTLHPVAGKVLKCAVSNNSGHFTFWSRARSYLRNMQYKEINGKLVRPPSLGNWEVTLNGLEHLSKHLQKTYKITFFRPRDINQDPIENFFGQVRQHGGRNINPSVYTFKNHFKTLLINNMVNRHSVSSNCEGEIDNSEMIINGVRHLVTQGVEEEVDKENIDISDIENINITEQNFSFIDKAAIGHVSGFIVRKVKSIKNCIVCNKNFICSDKISEWHDISQAKEYVNEISDKLKYCTPKLILGLADIYRRVTQILPVKCYTKNILLKLFVYVKKHVPFHFDECEHIKFLEDDIIKRFISLIAHNWADGVNKVLRGKSDSNIDVIYNKAVQYYNKKLKLRKRKLVELMK